MLEPRDLKDSSKEQRDTKDAANIVGGDESNINSNITEKITGSDLKGEQDLLRWDLRNNLNSSKEDSFLGKLTVSA